jgi:hypothetical protein
LQTRTGRSAMCPSLLPTPRHDPASPCSGTH